MSLRSLEVADIEEAFTFYGRIFRFPRRRKGQAFIDMADQAVG